MSEPQPRPRPLVLQIIPRPDPVSEPDPTADAEPHPLDAQAQLGWLRENVLRTGRPSRRGFKEAHACQPRTRSDGECENTVAQKKKGEAPVGFSLPSKAGASSS